MVRKAVTCAKTTSDSVESPSSRVGPYWRVTFLPRIDLPKSNKKKMVIIYGCWSCLRSFYELQCSIMIIKSPCYNYYVLHNNFRRKVLESFQQSLFYYIVQIFCIWLHEADFIMANVAQVCNVACGPLVYYVVKFIIKLLYIVKSNVMIRIKPRATSDSKPFCFNF